MIDFISKTNYYIIHFNVYLGNYFSLEMHKPIFEDKFAEFNENQNDAYNRIPNLQK